MLGYFRKKRSWVKGVRASLIVQLVKNPPASAGDPGSIPGLGRFSGEGISYPLQYSWASLVVQMVKNPPAMWETWVRFLSGQMSWRRALATHPSIRAWRIPMDRGALWATVHGVTKRVRHD